VDEFKGNEPQTGVQVPRQMMDRDPDTAYGIKEPAIGCVIQFTSHKDGRDYAAIRSADGWYVAGQRGRYTWSDLLADTQDTVFMMTPLAALHP
jgi:hypothetical protein